MPAMLSRIQAPMTQAPSSFCSGSAVSVFALPPRRTASSTSSSPWRSCWNCSVEVTAVPLHCRITSPLANPHSFAGLFPSARSTTRTPRANILMPTVWPTGTSSLGVSAARAGRLSPPTARSMARHSAAPDRRLREKPSSCNEITPFRLVCRSHAGTLTLCSFAGKARHRYPQRCQGSRGRKRKGPAGTARGVRSQHFPWKLSHGSGKF